MTSLTLCPTDWIAGVDGCRGGWLVVARTLGDPATARSRIVSSFAEILALPEAPRIVAVDMPIGLPERSQSRWARCDVAARANLGGRQSAIFAVPARAAVTQDDYREACAAALEHSDPPRKVSKQCFNLFPKIREIDALITPALQSRVFEVHPEVAFWAMNAQAPLIEPKKVKSQPYAPGLALRRGLLARAGYDPDFLSTPPDHRRSVAGHDDLLDAAAASWTAARIAAGTAYCFPAEPPHDTRGLAMAIWG